MADNYYAREDYIYSGDSIFTIPFDYIREDYIYVFIDDVATSEFSFLNDTQISVTASLTEGQVVSIIRSTDIERKLVTYTNTSILYKDNLNTAQDQVFHAVQELYDNEKVFEAEINEAFQQLSNQFTELESKVDDNFNTLQGEIDGLESKVDEDFNTLQTELDELSTDFTEKTEAINKELEAVNTELNEKADKSDTYTKTECDEKFLTENDIAEFVTETEMESYVDSAIAENSGGNIDVDLSDYATIEYVNSIAFEGGEINLTNYYTKEETEEALLPYVQYEIVSSDGYVVEIPDGQVLEDARYIVLE